jgi:hypothetical protein
MRCGGQTDDNVLSNRRATLEAIKGKGEAVMESQIVVDHTEVDGNGFLIGGVGNESLPMDELWAQIRSLERRANSRDSEALTLNESGERQRIYLLRLEMELLRSFASVKTIAIRVVSAATTNGPRSFRWSSISASATSCSFDLFLVSDISQT